MPRDWRDEFPGLRNGTYLNSCAQGQQSVRATRAATRWLEGWREDPSWERWVGEVETARREFARLIHADVDEVSVQANVSSGLSALLSSLDPAAGRDRIVTSDLDFPVAPLLAARQARRGWKHVHVRSSPQPLRNAEISTHLEGAGLLAIPHVASFTGYRFDVASVVEEAREWGVPVFVDAFQGLGASPLDVHEADVDFLASGVYKWLLGSVGIAFLYVRRDWHARLEPTTLGWYALDEPYGFDPLSPLAPDARRFDLGGPNVLGAAIATEGLRLVQEVGVDAIAEHNARLCDRIFEEADARGFEVLTPRAPEERASIVTFRVDRLAEALDALKREKVVVNSRLDGIRVSPHFYNREEDVARLFAVLDKR